MNSLKAAFSAAENTPGAAAGWEQNTAIVKKGKQFTKDKIWFLLLMTKLSPT